MRFNRIIAGTITAGLVGFVPVALSSPADAATVDLTTTTTVTTSSQMPITYGDEIRLSADVAASDGSSAYKGTVSLYVSTPAVPTWTLVANGTSTYESFSVKPQTNASYKVVYSGYAATSTYENNYVAGESAPIAVAVQRKVNLKTKRLVVIGKVKPDFGKKKVVIKRKKGKKYVAFKKIKTNKKGAFRFKAPGKKGFKFSVTIPSDTNYIGYTQKYYVY